MVLILYPMPPPVTTPSQERAMLLATAHPRTHTPVPYRAADQHYRTSIPTALSSYRALDIPTLEE